jgi:AcrR family transcriptional regulator
MKAATDRISFQMTNREINTENRIFRAACDVFLLYGYHGTKLRQIAERADVNKAAIHYYFSSKEKLYEAVVGETLELVLNPDYGSSIGKVKLEKPMHFFCTELYTNRDLFESKLKHLYPEEWVIKLKKIERWLEIRENLHSFQLNEKNEI